MPKEQDNPGVALFINPKLDTYHSAAELLNAILPYAEGFIHVSYTSYMGSNTEFSPHTTKVFSDGIVTMSNYDKKEYEKFINGKVQSYPVGLRTAMGGGAFVTLQYRSILRLQEHSEF